MLALRSRSEGFARVAVRDRPTKAAFLYGAAEALRESTKSPLPDADGADYRYEVKMARSRMDGVIFAEAWNRGRSASLEDVLATIEDSVDRQELAEP